MKKICKFCKGTGRIFKNAKGDAGVTKVIGLRFKIGKENSFKGATCKRCNGTGYIN